MKLFLGLVLSAISLSAHSANLFAFKSDIGHVIGWGESNTYDDSVAQFAVTDFPIECELVANGLNDKSVMWDISLHPPLGVYKFELKTYKDAGGFPTEAHPFISVFAHGLGCNSSGEFKVLEIEYGRNNKITKFAVDFVQRCENFKPALYGAYRFNSSVPNDLDAYIKSLNNK